MAFLAAAANGEEARLLRYPSIMGDKVAFVYAGDIWTVSAKGGQARRVTSFPEGLEIFPKISPDGKWIAFSGEYSGTRQVYVVPFEGGVPKRVTYYPDVGMMPPRGGYDYIVWDWTPDGKKLLVRCNRTPYGKRMGKYYLIDPFHEALAQPLQIPEGGPATLSPDGKKIAYDIKSREFRNWKRYRAGRAQDVWIYDLEKNEITQVTKFAGTDNFPMWIGNEIYFTSDKDMTLNLFKYDISTKKVTKVTNFTDYDVLWPSRGGNRIVYENGGYLYYYDVSSGKNQQIHVELGSDKPYVRPIYKNVSKYIESFTISPSGVRAAFGARGDVFTVPAEHGIIHNITQTDGTREMDVEWSPDGRYISFLGEADGEYEIMLIPHDGKGKVKQLTSGSDSWIIHPVWSPDGKSMAYSDKKNRLFVLSVKTGKKTLVDRCEYNSIDNYSFSPGGKWICYTKTDPNYMTSIWVYSIEKADKMRLTTDFTDDREPVFSKDGKYIYFVSSRDFDFSRRRFKDRIYVGVLSEETPSPLAPIDDEEKPKTAESKEKPSKEKGKKGSEESGVIVKKIDAEGFADRVVALPVEPGRYYGLTAIDGGVVYLNGDKELKMFKFDDRKEKLIVKDVANYEVASGGKKFVYRSGKDYFISDLRPSIEAGKGKLDLSKMVMRIDPRKEWRQIYFDAWRIMRDWFYDPKMHHVDWTAMRDKYKVLLPYVAHRTDLDYILGELVGELNCGHTYIFRGDMPKVDRVPVGLLGCELKADGTYYRIEKIYRGENWHEETRSPLTEPGLNVKAGDYIIAIDGHEVTTKENPYKYLENKVGVQVTLTINSRPASRGARDIVVTPIASELKLRYLDWVEHNREYVDRLSGGKIGYMHVPDTEFEGFREFFKAFQPLMKKEALIVDDRYNGGGYSPFPMVQILGNRIINYWAVRNTALYPEPFPVNEGPKVMLINGLSSSGGDEFPYMFRAMGVGPLIGEKTWGGLVGYGYSPGYVDGGGMSVPGFAFVNAKGQWDVEGKGVDPDIHVFDDPTKIVKGDEPMLDKAVKYLLEQLKKNPPKKITKPASPDRS